MTIVAIHQPNYCPWLGYFHKIARAGVFVFLDDVQFSKQSYINRVQIRGAGGGGPRWLTQPVSVSLGQAINEVAIARPDWARAHLDTLRGLYRNAAAFKAAWPDVTALYDDLDAANVAQANRALIERLAARLGLAADFVTSSDVATGDAAGDDRLVAIVDALAPGGTYLSGRGGGKYQDPAKFAAAGLSLVTTGFQHPSYDQGQPDFVPGLSVLDAVFHLGWDRTAALLTG